MQKTSGLFDEKDVYFETPEMPLQPAHSLLYGLEPYGIGTGACESLKSYMYRLADAHRISSKSLVKIALFNQLVAQSICWTNFRDCQFKTISYYLSPGNITKGLITVLNEATGVGGLANCTMLPMHHLLGMRDLFSSVERHCPLCLRESIKTGMLYGHLIWVIACVTACPVHEVQLVTSKCGAPREKYLKLSSRKNLAGVCSTCGSIGYQCIEGTPLKASDVAVWKAIQVAELISSFPYATQNFSLQSTIDGLSTLISSYGDGKSAVAARKAGLSKSILWEWIHGKHLPSLGRLLVLCLAASVSLVSVMNGRSVECTSPLPDVKLPKLHTQKPTGEVRENALIQALSVNPPQSLSAIATALGLSSKMLRKKYPELSRLVVERFRRYKASQFAERDRQIREIGLRAIKELTVKGMPLTLRNFQSAVGKVMMPGSRLREFLMEARITAEQ